MHRKKYQKKESSTVTAVQIALDTDGLAYRKWGGLQQGKAGDWLIDNNGSCYTIDKQSFADTYVEVSKGQYRKTAPVWAEVADTEGTVKTKEGSTDYLAGDYIVFNKEDGSDSYAVTKQKFESDYTEVE